MKLAAVLTSRVMDAVGQLPGVATIDWCDRAASALCRLHHPAVAFVTLVSLDTRGFVMDVEAAGASRSTQPPLSCAESFALIDKGRTRGPSPHLADTIGDAALATMRESLHQGDWIGWAIGQLNENLWHLSTALPLGLISPSNPGPIIRRWSPFKPVDVLLTATAIPGHKPGRWLIAEVGSSDPSFTESNREQAALSAALPTLALRLYTAFGKEPVNIKHALTPREEEVLWRLVSGMKVPEIAEELERSPYTVHDHVKSLHRKLNAKSRGELVAKALGHIKAGHDHVIGSVRAK